MEYGKKCCTDVVRFCKYCFIRMPTTMLQLCCFSVEKQGSDLRKQFGEIWASDGFRSRDKSRNVLQLIFTASTKTMTVQKADHFATSSNHNLQWLFHYFSFAGCACRFLYGPETKDENKGQIEKSLDGKLELKLEVIFYKKNGKRAVQLWVFSDQLLFISFRSPELL